VIAPDSRGFRAIPYALEEELRQIPPVQRSIITSIIFLASWQAGSAHVRGVQVPLDFGEALVGYESTAKTLRLPGAHTKGAKQVKRAVASARRLGIFETRPALHPNGTPCVTGDRPPPDGYRGTRSGTPPTIVRVVKYRDMIWLLGKGGSP